MPEKPVRSGNRFSIPTDPARLELEQIKQRQRERKQGGTPKTVTSTELWQMLSDVLENQARIENKLNDILGILGKMVQ